jgi:hypothetical protein
MGNGDCNRAFIRLLFCVSGSASATQGAEIPDKGRRAGADICGCDHRRPMRGEGIAQRDYEEGQRELGRKLREGMRAKIWIRSLCPGHKENL